MSKTIKKTAAKVLPDAADWRAAGAEETCPECKHYLALHVPDDSCWGRKDVPDSPMNDFPADAKCMCTYGNRITEDVAAARLMALDAAMTQVTTALVEATKQVQTSKDPRKHRKAVRAALRALYAAAEPLSLLNRDIERPS